MIGFFEKKPRKIWSPMRLPIIGHPGPGKAPLLRLLDEGDGRRKDRFLFERVHQRRLSRGLSDKDRCPVVVRRDRLLRDRNKALRGVVRPRRPSSWLINKGGSCSPADGIGSGVR